MNVEKNVKIEGALTVSEFLQNALLELGDSGNNKVVSGVVIINTLDEKREGCLIGMPVMSKNNTDSVASFLMLPDLATNLVAQTLKGCPESLIDLVMEAIRDGKTSRD